MFSVASSLFKKALIFTEGKNHVLLADLNINIPQQLLLLYLYTLPKAKWVVRERLFNDKQRLYWLILHKVDTYLVRRKTPLYLAVKVSFRVALEEILKNHIFSIRFIYSIHAIKV